MTRCPRCGGETDLLYSLPPETLAEKSGSETKTSHGQACQWCIQEVTEG